MTEDKKLTPEDEKFLRAMKYQSDNPLVALWRLFLVSIGWLK